MNIGQSWLPINQHNPPNGLVVNTRIEDGAGVRNEQFLFRRNNLWFLPDGSMYVYYTPTHWSPR